MQCIGHEEIVADIKARYDEGRTEISVVHGPYGVGKTHIAVSLAEGCNGIYLMGRMANERIHVEALNAAMGIPSDPGETFEAAFTKIVQASEEKRMMLIIDEYPSLVEAVPQVPLIIRDVLTAHQGTAQLFMVLIGRDVDQLQGRILGDASLVAPFITGHHEVKGLSLADVARLEWNYTSDELEILHRVTNGLPGYLTYIDTNATVDDNLVRLFFSTTGALFMEPDRILHREMRTVTAPNAILSALAQMDKPFYMELNHASQVKSGTFSTRLTDLLNLGIVGRVQGSRNYMRHSDYHFINTMFEFWYQFVYPNLEAIYSGRGESVYYDAVKPKL